MKPVSYLNLCFVKWRKYWEYEWRFAVTIFLYQMDCLCLQRNYDKFLGFLSIIYQLIIPNIGVFQLCHINKVDSCT